MDTVATGEHAWAPSIGVLVDDDDGSLGDNIEKAHSKDAIRLEGTSDSEEESNFLKDLNQIVNNEIQGTQRMRNDSPTTKQIQGKKGKRVDMSSKQGKKDNKAKKMKTQSSGSAKLSEQIDRLVATVESRGNELLISNSLRITRMWLIDFGRKNLSMVKSIFYELCDFEQSYGHEIQVSSNGVEPSQGSNWVSEDPSNFVQILMSYIKKHHFLKQKTVGLPKKYENQVWK
ncbi:hypothetical protein GH714_025042 [Hevea brasiliensis]|uniref:Uncharacterized protein n=1 Tax=Hevea brasiliensis TaxID=3981 RepID=A0A6A6NK24_HEVBR|nr:hypothetical protein GH714_025042 [Hevea brasiliensis]